MKAAAVLLVTTAAGLIALARTFFVFAFTRNSGSLPGKQSSGGEPDLRSWAKFRDAHAQAHERYLSRSRIPVQIQAEDGTVLAGEFIRCQEPHRTVLCAHGYRGVPSHDFASVSAFLLDHHCDLLLIDQRAHGNSGGDYVTFGVREKTDVRDWCRCLEGQNASHLPVYLYGISMGGATVLLAAGEDLPDCVTGVIADCAYSSAERILAEQGRRQAGIVSGPVLKIMELMCRAEAGFDLRDGNVEETLASCRLPVLFLHGSEDHFVSVDHSQRNYAACASEKKLVLIEGAVHASSFDTDPVRYGNALLDFFGKREGRNSLDA